MVRAACHWSSLGATIYNPFQFSPSSSSQSIRVKRFNSCISISGEKSSYSFLIILITSIKHFHYFNSTLHIHCVPSFILGTLFYHQWLYLFPPIVSFPHLDLFIIIPNIVLLLLLTSSIFKKLLKPPLPSPFRFLCEVSYFIADKLKFVNLVN